MPVMKGGYCLRIGPGFFAPLRMMVARPLTPFDYAQGERGKVRGPRPPSFPWRREPTPPLDARRHGHDDRGCPGCCPPIGVGDKLRIKCEAGVTGMTIEAALDDRSPIGVGDKLRIKCEAGYTGMTIEARGKRGIGGSLDFPAQPTRCGKM